MNLEGLHHVTAITGDAQRNLNFYVGLLGMRFVKRTVNFDAPDVYHLYYGDEIGNPGSILTFFEFRGSPIGHAGIGMIYRLVWRVSDRASIDFWALRLSDAGIESERGDDTVLFTDPEGLELQLTVDTSDDEALMGASDDIPAEHALRGFDGVRAYSDAPGRSEPSFTGALGFAAKGEANYVIEGGARRASFAFDAATERGLQGAGTVHHIAWACEPENHGAWRERIVSAGLDVTPIIDRLYFKSIYFREPSGVLFEIATIGPGFGVDESLETLGQRLSLPQWYEGMRAQLETGLTPLTDPRPRH